ncbi:MAG: carboxypeptidase regulatory-like domain-containing protein [Acidimicrobiales bacterium]
MRLVATPTQLIVAIGDPIVLQLEVYNSRNVIDGFQASLLGVGDVTFVPDPLELSLFPETGGVMVLTFTLPAGFPAGRRVIGVKVASVTHPRESAVEEITLDVAPLNIATLAVEPLMVTAAKRADFVLTLENRGNVAFESALGATDSTAKLIFALAPPTLTVGPGETALARVAATGRRPWIGSPVPRQITFTAGASPEPLSAAATLLHKPIIPRGVLTLLTILAAIALWGLVLLVGVNQIVDKVTEGDEELAAMSGPIPGNQMGSVAGKVTAKPDANGATVSLIALPSGEDGAAPAGEVPAPVVTPPTGEYNIENVTAPGTYQIVFAKAGFGTQSKLVELKLGEALEGVDVALVAGSGSITGTVADGDGPLGGVVVVATNGTDTVSTLTSSSGPVGTYALESLPPGTWVVTYEKADFGSQTKVLDVAPGQKVAAPPLTLTKGRGSISGTVFGQGGQPVPGVLVSVTAGTGTIAPIVVPGTSTTAPPTPTTTTGPPPAVLASTASLDDGPVGFFALSGLPTPGTFTVTFQKVGFLPLTATVTLADNGNESGLSPILRPVTGVVSGVVREDVRRVPACEPTNCLLGGVAVRVTDRNGQEVRNTTSANAPADVLGRYEVAGLQAGTYTITFTKVGYASQTFSLTLADNQQNPLDVLMKGEPATLAGKATNCTAVALVLRDNTNLDPPVLLAARPDGTYRITRVETPSELRVLFIIGNQVRDIADVDLQPGEVVTDLNGVCTPPPTTAATCALVIPILNICIPP